MRNTQLTSRPTRMTSVNRKGVMRSSACKQSRSLTAQSAHYYKRIDPFKLWKGLGLNQSDFWGRLAVNQSGGSRYENGRRMPGPVGKLLGTVYLKEKQYAANRS